MSLDLTKLLFFTIFSCIKFAQLLSIPKTGILPLPDHQGPILDKIKRVTVSTYFDVFLWDLDTMILG